MHLRMTEAPSPRAHDTQRLPGHEGWCLKAHSLPQPRSMWRIVFIILMIVLYQSPCLAEGQLASCKWKGQLRREMPSRWQNPHQIATMCATALMTKGSLSEAYAPMMFQLIYSYANTSIASSLRNASERWLPVHSAQKIGPS